jgi:hypothetical protein
MVFFYYYGLKPETHKANWYPATCPNSPQKKKTIVVSWSSDWQRLVAKTTQKQSTTDWETVYYPPPNKFWQEICKTV